MSHQKRVAWESLLEVLSPPVLFTQGLRERVVGNGA